MSLNQPVLLDIQLPAKELILQKFNAGSSLNLVLDDFDFGPPSVYVPITVGSKLNTKVVLTPKVTSAFYSSFDIFYTRMNIATILDNDNISVPRDGALVLSDLVRSINSLYGIHLTVEDFVEKVLPTLDPMDPDAPVSVLVEMKPTSLLFFGNFNLTLNQVSGGGSEEPVEEEPALVYALVSHPYDPVRAYTVECVNSIGEPVSNFVFMRNAVTISTSSIMRMFVLPNNDIVIQGQIVFNMLVNNVLTDYEAGSLVLAPNGAVKRVMMDAATDFGFTNNINWRYQCRPGSNKVYTYDTSGIARFNLDGTRDNTFVPAALGYPASNVKEDIDGNLYTVSPPFWGMFDDDSNPGTPMVDTLMVKIDRLLPTGAKDLTFTPVVIRMTGEIGNVGVWPVYGLALIESAPTNPVPGGPTKVADGFYIALMPHETPSSKTDTPIINDVPVVPPDPDDEEDEYAFAPIFRFLQSGIWDTTFNAKQNGITPDAVYINDDRFVSEGLDVLGVYNKQPVWFTNRRNPITGFIHQMPVRFKANGKMEHISGDSYVATPRWYGATGLKVLNDGNILIGGDVKVQDSNGDWVEDPSSFLMSFNASTTPDDIIYDPPDVNGGPSYVREFYVVQS